MSRKTRMFTAACVAVPAVVLGLGAAVSADDGLGTDGTRITGGGQ
jgi:hypothetical protein